MAHRVDHHELALRGWRLHESKNYSAALRCFDRALQLQPNCPTAIYNRANTLHMLGRDQEAYPLLLSLIKTSPEKLQQRCGVARPRSLQLDAYQLLFWVVLYGKGFCKEAFRFAFEHLRRRKRGLHSVWSAREVKADIAAMRQEWKRQTA